MPPAPDSDAAAASSSPYASNPSSAGHAKTILAVDDEPGIARLIKINLERSGFAVDTASDGAEALSQLLKKRYDLLITDLQMPRMDGLELLSHVRGDPEIRNMPVIVLTAQGADADITRGYMTGADLYLTKPFSPDELIQFVHRVLG